MNDLVQSVSIEDLLNKREAIIERLESMRKLHAEIDALSLQYFSTSKVNGDANYFIRAKQNPCETLPKCFSGA